MSIPSPSGPDGRETNSEEKHSPGLSSDAPEQSAASVSVQEEEDNAWVQGTPPLSMTSAPGGNEDPLPSVLQLDVDESDQNTQREKQQHQASCTGSNAQTGPSSGPAPSTPNTSAPSMQTHHASSGYVSCPFAPGGPLAPKRTWKQRHPFLFWVLIIFLVLTGASLPGAIQQQKLNAMPQIGIVRVEGIIMDESRVLKWIEQLQQSPHIQGVIVRVNSPGGAVGPSQEIYAAVKRLSQTKRVIVSMGGVAASGGYYVALGGTEIFAGPATLTGSIGVIMDVPNFEQLMKTVGISNKTLATGPLKGAGATTREMTPEEEAYFQGLLQDMYNEFINTVAERRNLPLEQVKKVADGRALTGRQAKQAGLIDTLGGFSDAKLRMRELCSIAADQQVHYVEEPEKPTTVLRELMEGMLGFEPGTALSPWTPQFHYR